ncbi:hypothetical protein EAF00_001321 [Botryotinia globosa]|nr:hypothetical protein EAF00_001321 [Botryotinia globosa]
MSAITQAAAPAAAQQQGTVTIENTTTQAAAPAAVEPQATTTIEIMTTETVTTQPQMTSSAIPSEPSTSSTSTDKGTTRIAKQAGLNSPSEDKPPSADLWNNSTAVAALIFENAGVVVLFAVNVIFTQRILRATHPNIGWNPIVSKTFFAILISVPFIIFWNIISLTISFFTLNPRSLETTKNLLLFGSCWTLFLSLFPAIFVTLATAIPSSTLVEKIGAGRFRMKPIILMLATALLVTGAITRLLGAVIEKPISAPSHLFSKPVFYTTGFMLEIIVVYGYPFLRVDLRFWVPNGTGSLAAQGSAGSYTVKSEDDEEKLVDGSGDEGKSRATSL